MSGTWGEQSSLFEDLGIPPGLGLLLLFGAWCLVTWYWWTRARPAVEQQLGEKLARTWRAVIPFFFAVWVLGTGLSFVVAFVRRS